MDDLRFTPAVLVTGEDERENEFCWYYASEKFIDGYNVSEVSAETFRAIYPQVYKVYFSDTIMTGDQWRAMQCPLSLSNIQIDEWRKAQQTHPAETAYELEQAMDAEARAADSWRDERLDYDYTPSPSGMPDIDLGKVDEIPF